uniref:Cardioactive peptide n=1 Tax=Timema tahoe TaxID=61484 RepID=A0A7R9FI19_9NEOP|nr:unnamed protein product [Timema tahoe]
MTSQVVRLRRKIPNCWDPVAGRNNTHVVGRLSRLQCESHEVDPADMERLLDPKRKRPFCNAFTGCGKKRSDESMGTLVDLNSEPAVEELSRQILSEAKLWEAIQEARIELLRRRQEQVSSTVPALDSKELLILGEQDEEGG